MKINPNLIAVILILVIGGLYYNVTLNSPIVFGDEGYYAYQSRWMAENKIIPKYEVFKESDIFHPVLTKPPMFFLTEIFAWGLGGELGIKLLIPVFSILSAFMIYLILKKHNRPKAGLAAALILLATPSLVTYGVLGYVDTLFCLFFICSIYFGYLAFKNNNKINTVLAGIFAGLAILTKITGPLIIIFFLVYLVFKKFKGLKIFLIISLIAVIIAMPWIARNIILFNDVCYPKDCPAVIDKEIPRVEGLESAGRTAQVGTEMGVWKMGLLNYVRFAFGLTIPILFLFGIVGSLFKKEDIDLFFILLLIIFILLFFYTTSRAEDTARYTLPVSISIAAIAGSFVSDSYKWLKGKSIAIAIIFVVVFLCVTWFYGQEKLDTMYRVKHFPQGFFDACKWVKQNTPEDSSLFSVYAQQTAYNCYRKTLTANPDTAEIMFSYNDTSYEHLKLHGYDYIFIMHNLISIIPYGESIPLRFVNYLGSSEHFKKVYDNTNVYGQSGVSIYQVI